MKDPFSGIGKPEPLKFLDPDTWSRRIDLEHRLVYRVRAERIDFSKGSLSLQRLNPFLKISTRLTCI